MDGLTPHGYELSRRDPNQSFRLQRKSYYLKQLLYFMTRAKVRLPDLATAGLEPKPSDSSSPPPTKGFLERCPSCL